MNDLFERLAGGAVIAAVAMLPLPIAAQESVDSRASGTIGNGAWGSGRSWHHHHHHHGRRAWTERPFWEGIVPQADFGAIGRSGQRASGLGTDLNGGDAPLDPGLTGGAGNGNGNGNIGSNNGNGNLTNGNGNFGIGDGVGNGGRVAPNE